MYIYNTTSAVSPEIHQEWLQWIQEEYKLKVLKYNNIETIRIFKILGNPNEPTYAIHHQTESPQQLMNFIKNEMLLLQNECLQRFGDKVLMFGTELKEV